MRARARAHLRARMRSSYACLPLVLFACSARCVREHQLGREAAIDDLLFVQDDHKTFATHCAVDGIPMLFSNAIWSQTHLLLLITCLVQFIHCPCVLSLITVAALPYSFAAFPQAPPRLWELLSLYSALVIVVKLTCLTPILCWDGKPFWLGVHHWPIFAVGLPGCVEKDDLRRA
mmetsp:Transcript_174658/g.554326  ORF Transcript_174658/g.554326 Transcript_174658/m.554326 type:complete len:175 (-) Transcript_174658:276-800(-)